jgi:hypothetical protein
MKRAALKILIILLLAYIGSYLAFREQHIERWEKDQRDYVIFPVENRTLYYFYRPLTIVDGSATGMQFHIGPHR